MKDKNNIEKLVLEHLPLIKMVVKRIAGSLSSSVVDFEDLVGYGIIGLLEAYKNFNPKKKIKFSTYAFYRIKGAILDALRAIDWLPRPTREKINKLEEAIEELQNKYGREVDEDQLANYLKMDVNEVRSLMLSAQQANIFSLEELIYENTSFTDFENIEKKEIFEVLVSAISSLPEREKLIINLYYYEGLNLKEIAQILELSESRVCQIISKVVKTLKEKLEYIKSEILY